MKKKTCPMNPENKSKKISTLGFCGQHISIFKNAIKHYFYSSYKVGSDSSYDRRRVKW